MEEKKELERLLYEYKDVLRSEPGFTNRAKHVINTGTLCHVGLNHRLYPAQKVKDKRSSERMETKTIEPSASPMTSPKVEVKKPDKTLYRFSKSE